MATEKEKTELSYPERMDIPQVTLAEAKKQILLSLRSKQRRGCFILVGESGLGKTQIFNQIQKEENYTIHPIHTAHWGLMGSGIPRKAEGMFFDVAVPSIFPREGEKAILLFDELNQGLKHAIAMFFTMLEDGRMFNYVLPEDCLVVGTMNPDTAQYAVTNIENNAAIRRRVKFLYIVPEFTGWVNHAKTEAFHANTRGIARDKACHPGILGFIKAHSKLLYDDKARDQGKQYLCPATVETISEDAYNMDKENIPLDGPFASVRFASSIGITVATQLTEFLKDSSVKLTAPDVLNGYNKKSQRTVNQWVAQSRQEKLADLSEDVLRLLFAEKHKVKAVAPHFLNFCKDLPEELTSSMLTQMAKTAEMANAGPYLDELMDVLQDYEDWIQMQFSLDNNHREVDEGLKK